MMAGKGVVNVTICKVLKEGEDFFGHDHWELKTWNGDRVKGSSKAVGDIIAVQYGKETATGKETKNQKLLSLEEV